jgi:branched-chain amino acid transport system substrate-binding protein
LVQMVFECGNANICAPLLERYIGEEVIIGEKTFWLEANKSTLERSLAMKMRPKGSCVWVMMLVFALLSGGFICKNEEAIAASPTVPPIKIALAYPLSGTLSRNGNLEVQGIKAAMNWVNDNGGIKSLGGAHLVPVVGDTGSTVEGAGSVMDRLCRDPEIVMAMGSWASSLTFASTEVTERLRIPQFSISFADALHDRGFKWGFYVGTPMSANTDLGFSNVISLAKGAGQPIKTAMIVGDNQAASKAGYEASKNYFKNVGINVVGEEIWAMGTLTDATPVIQKVKSLNPDVVVYGAGSISEAQMGLMKRRELGVKIPFIAQGGWIADPSMKQVGDEFLEGLMLFSPCFPHKLTPEDWIKRAQEQCRKEYSNEPFVGQELNFGWITIPIMAEILERAASRNREAIRETAHKVDLHDIPATRATAKQGMAFDEKGRIVKKYQEILIVQWQGGTAKVVYPSQLASAKPIWMGTK